jgi:hypothetical protein
MLHEVEDNVDDDDDDDDNAIFNSVLSTADFTISSNEMTQKPSKSLLTNASLWDWHTGSTPGANILS